MRTLSGKMLVLGMLLAAGCGKPDSTPSGSISDPKGQTPSSDPGQKAKPTDPGSATPPAKAPAVAVWEMDPAKHAYSGPLAGKLRGKSVPLVAQAEREALRFRAATKEGMPAESAIEIVLRDPSKSLEGLHLTVKPDQPEGLEVPTVIVYHPQNVAEQPQMLVKGYALTLEVGRREKGKLPGRIYLCLPDESQSFVAGTFSADWIRPITELPGPDDAPFIQGKLVVKGVTDPNVWLGYVRVDPHDAASPPSSDVVGTDLKPKNPPARSEGNRPRTALLVPGPGGSKDPARFEFTHLEPGRYWVFATVKGGPAAWKWVSIDPGSQLAIDFTIDAAVFGSAEVTAPGGADSVAIVPASEPGKPWPASLVATAASITELRVDTSASKKDPAKPLTLKFPRLAPGKYEVWAGGASQSFEVKANETAKVEIKKK